MQGTVSEKAFHNVINLLLFMYSWYKHFLTSQDNNKSYLFDMQHSLEFFIGAFIVISMIFVTRLDIEGTLLRNTMNRAFLMR